MKRIALASMLASLLAGCVTASNVDQVRAGMSPDQVQSVLGEPETVAHAPGSQCSYYTVLKDFWSRTPWSLSNRYYVCYDDGKVKSFGRVDAPATSG
jgi:hypothetical protein